MLHLVLHYYMAFRKHSMSKRILDNFSKENVTCRIDTNLNLLECEISGAKPKYGSY